MKPKPPQRSVNPHVQAAQLTLVEKALVEFTEEVDGRVSTDEEILAHGFHVTLQPGPLTTFLRDGKEWSNYYVWRRTNALALTFDPKNALVLHAVRLTTSEWPVALRMFCAKKFAEEASE